MKAAKNDNIILQLTSEYNTESQIKNQKPKTKNSKIENRKSKIKNQKSKIENQKPKIENQKSKIENQNQKSRNQKASIPRCSSMSCIVVRISREMELVQKI